MTSDQYKALLQELAHVAGVSDTASLFESGRLRIGELNALLEHDAAYDEHLLQVRVLLGGFPAEQEDIIPKALLEANYVSGYGGECVFSLFPETNDVVITMKMRLSDSLTAQDLWQELTEIARQGTQMWETITAVAAPGPGAFAADLHASHARGL